MRVNEREREEGKNEREKRERLRENRPATKTTF